MGKYNNKYIMYKTGSVKGVVLKNEGLAEQKKYVYVRKKINGGVLYLSNSGEWDDFDHSYI